MSKIEKVLRVGDKVGWRASWGSDKAREAVVIRIEICQIGRKEGNKVDSVPWSKVNSREVVVDLDNEHWAYGTQLDYIEN
jgi:hypothetical protein